MSIRELRPPFGTGPVSFIHLDFMKFHKFYQFFDLLTPSYMT